MTATTSRPASTPRAVTTTACWCCERAVGPGAQRCRHCGVPMLRARRATPAPVRRGPVIEPAAPSPLVRPVGAGSLLLSAIGLLSWCVMLAA